MNDPKYIGNHSSIQGKRHFLKDTSFLEGLEAFGMSIPT